MNDNVDFLFPPEREFGDWRAAVGKRNFIVYRFGLWTSEYVTCSKINYIKIRETKTGILYQSRDDGDLYWDGGNGVGKKETDSLAGISWLDMRE